MAEEIVRVEKEINGTVYKYQKLRNKELFEQLEFLRKAMSGFDGTSLSGGISAAQKVSAASAKKDGEVDTSEAEHFMVSLILEIMNSFTMPELYNFAEKLSKGGKTTRHIKETDVDINLDMNVVDIKDLPDLVLFFCEVNEVGNFFSTLIGLGSKITL